MELGTGLQAVAVFGFLAVVVWLRSRKEQRIAADRHDIYRKMLEQSGASVDAVHDLMLRDDERLAQKDIDDARSAGMILVALGIGLAVFLLAVAKSGDGIYLVGAIPGLIGMAQLLHATILARRRHSKGVASSGATR
jgi:Flp pilus assembly protein TadB